MAYDEGLAHRVRERLRGEPGLTEMERFGGLGFMLEGNLACGVVGDALVARVGPEAYEAALEAPGARPFDFTGRPMRGWVFVDPPGLESDEALDRWVERSTAFAGSLPPK